MKFLLFFIVALLGSAGADDTVKTGTQEAQDQIIAPSSNAAAPTPELVASHNYSIEIHHVTTEDGYILEVHRIPGSPTSPAAHGKPVAFLMHGLWCSSADWVVLGPGKSLAYILADAGFDVWMGNARGNTYSRNHTALTTNSKEFWEFSWHEIGIYDLPAMIDYALETTGQRQVIYVGHSQGGTSFFVMMSQKPSFNDKIEVMFALAPAVYMGHAFNPVLRLFSLSNVILTGLSAEFGVYEFFPSTNVDRAVRAAFCGNNAVSRLICYNVISILGGYDRAQLNDSSLPIIFGHFPASVSVRQMFHYFQEVESGKFRQYDYGLIENVAKYGSVSPPDYDLSSITVPVHVTYSDNDWLVAVKDITQLFNELGNPIEMRRVPYKTWAHFDHLWAIDVKELVYDHVLNELRDRYNYSSVQ